jgi:hypothetical protein
VKATEVRQSQGHSDAEMLIKEARQRQRRRYAVTVLAIIAALAGVLGAFAGLHGSGRPQSARQPSTRPQASHPARPPSSIPASVGTTLLMWPVGGGQAGGIYLYNLRIRHLGLAPVPGIDPGEFQPIMSSGPWVVYVMESGVWAVTSEVKGTPRLLGKTLLFAPSATAGHVWLEYGAFGPGPVTVRSVSIASGRASSPVALPAGTQLMAGTAAGLLLTAHSGILLWNPGAAPRLLPASASARGFAVSAQLVAYDTGCADEATSQNSDEPGAGYSACRMLRVYNVITGSLRSFAAPAGTRGWVASHGGFIDASAIAPAGMMMAAEAVIQPASQGRVRLFVLRLARRNQRPVDVPSSAAFLWAATAWSAKGSWLFYQGPSARLRAYQVTTGQVRSSDIPCCQYTVMAPIHR